MVNQLDGKYKMAGVLFCLKCGSSRVDVIGWKGQFHAEIRCFHCGNVGTLLGFTIGRCYKMPPDAIIEAVYDRAGKRTNNLTG